MSKKEVVSIDVGYGFVKAVSSSGMKVIFPSVVGTGRERGFAHFLQDKTTEMDLSELHIKLDGNKHYYVGDMAIKNSLDGTRVFERERYNHEYSKVLMNVAIHLVTAPDTEEVILFTGLPLDYYKTQHQQFKEKLLEESPTIEWLSGLNAEKRKVKVIEAGIFPQGMSAVWAALINHDGKTLRKDLMTEGNQIGIIDIGFRTTDVCVVEMKEGGGFIPLLPFCETIDQGVVNLHENVKNAFKTKAGGSDLSENKINRILKQKAIKYKGKTIELSKEVNEAYEAVVNSINDRINKLWKEEANTFDYIFVVGGGGTFFLDYLQEKFEGRLLSITAGQFANAIGYYRIGKLLFRDFIHEKVTTCLGEVGYGNQRNLFHPD